MLASRSVAAFAISLLVHAALAMAVVAGLFSPRIDAPKPPSPLIVTLQPKQPAALPPTPLPQPSSPPVPQPAAPKPKKRERQKPPPAAKPAPRPIAPEKPSAAPIPAPSQAPAPTPSTPQAPPLASAPAAPATSTAPIRTGVSIPASYAASNRKPEHPPLSRRYGEQGTVILRVLVREDGTAGEVQISKSSGYPLLDASAKSAVQEWRFNPATSDGKPVAEWYRVPITFTLRE